MFVLDAPAAAKYQLSQTRESASSFDRLRIEALTLSLSKREGLR